MQLVNVRRRAGAFRKCASMVALLLILPLGLQASSWTWSAEDIEPTGGESPALALDQQGNLHVSYYVMTGGVLMYAFRGHDGSKWYPMRLDQGLIVLSTGITIDPSGNPHVCYTPNGLKYAHFDGRKWYTQAVDPGSGVVGYLCSIRVTAAGSPMISWYVSTGGFRYAYLKDGAWIATRLDGNPNDYAGKWNSIALDAQSNPSIAYSDFPAGQLRFAQFNGKVWIRSVVQSLGDEPGGYKGMGASLALDAQQNPWISYYDEQNLRLAHRVDGKWIKQVVEKIPPYPGDWGWKEMRSDILLDHEGHPHIVYESLEGLKHAWWDGTDWHIQMIVAAAGNPEFDNSAVINKDDVIYIAYRDPLDKSLKLATGKPSHPENPDPPAH